MAEPNRWENEYVNKYELIAALTYSKEIESMQCGDLHKIFDVIKRCRPADVVQRYKGEWIVEDIQTEGEGPGTASVKCPQCGFELMCAADDVPNFCQDCGADLRKPAWKPIF